MSCRRRPPGRGHLPRTVAAPVTAWPMSADESRLPATIADGALVARLRSGDGAAFRELVRSHHAAMVRVAETFVPGRAVAEEVVQETWLAVIKGIDGFEGARRCARGSSAS